MLLSLVTYDSQILSHGRLPDPQPKDGLIIVIHYYGKSLTLCGVEHGKLKNETYLSVPFSTIENRNTLTTVKNYYRPHKGDGYMQTSDRKILQAVGWVFNNAFTRVQETDRGNNSALHIHKGKEPDSESPDRHTTATRLKLEQTSIDDCSAPID